MTTSSPGMARTDTLKCHPASLKWSMQDDRIFCIMRTGGRISTAWGEERRDQGLIKLNQQKKKAAEYFAKHIQRYGKGQEEIRRAGPSFLLYPFFGFLLTKTRSYSQPVEIVRKFHQNPYAYRKRTLLQPKILCSHSISHCFGGINF